jgi:pimeloyl-ACP methyl ester carboxylesterase
MFEVSTRILYAPILMGRPNYFRASDLRGLNRLANGAIVGLTELVEAMHHTILRTPSVFGRSPRGRTNGITGLVYRSVRGVTRAVGVGVDALLGALAPLIAEKRSSQEREAVVAALNGVLGDYLVASGNPLAIPMCFRAAGVPLCIDRAALAAAFPDPGRKVIVLVHGLCMNDLQWNRDGHDHGAALARDLGYTPIYLHYNTGRHIAANGSDFAALLEMLVREWPQPLERLAIVGHSMGGLVARSACHLGALSGHKWPGLLQDLIFLGTPHFGAPAERAGAKADFLLGISPYSAPFARMGKIRSAGIQDLRHGNLGNRPPLPDGVRCYAIAASRQQRTSSGSRIRGDGLVPVNSALGHHRDASLSLALPDDHRWVGYGMGHFDLLSRQEVYDRIRSWLAANRGTLIASHPR